MLTAFKAMWPFLKPFFGNFYALLLITAGVISFVSFGLPPLINADFLSMFFGIMITIVLVSIELTSVVCFFNSKFGPE